MFILSVRVYVYIQRLIETKYSEISLSQTMNKTESSINLTLN